MIFYLTYNDGPSGIYSSQVIDVVKFLRFKFNIDIRLISFISIRSFRSTKKKIKIQFPGTVVLPMFPKFENWRWNLVLLSVVFLIKRPRAVICRNAIPTNLAISMRRMGLTQKVVYDGRGVEYEQMREYKIVSDKKLMDDIFHTEKVATLNSDFQIAVTSSLVEYWQKNFNYKKTSFVVIPCTLNSIWQLESKNKIALNRKEMGFREQDIVLAYSGSISGWQSFAMMEKFLEVQLAQEKSIKLLLLTKKSEEVDRIISQHQDFVYQRWCEENEVAEVLALADYGLLLREDTITNRVASPVKFAEYLYAGLDVIISDNLKDYSLFIGEHKCGKLYKGNPLVLERSNQTKRARNKNLANEYLTKECSSVRNKYLTVINSC